MTTQQKNVALEKTTIHPEDRERFEEILRTRKCDKYNELLLIPEESKYAARVPVNVPFRKLIGPRESHRDLFEVCSHVTSDWKEEESLLGESRHVYISRIWPGEEVDLVDLLHGHEEKVERIEPVCGLLYCIAGPYDTSTRQSTGYREIILLHSEPEFLEPMNKKKSIKRLPFVAFRPGTAHAVGNLLEHTLAIIAVVSQSGDVTDKYPVSI